MTAQLPSLGRVVLVHTRDASVVHNGETEFAAIVTQVLGGAEPLINVKVVLAPMTEVFDLGSVRHEDAFAHEPVGPCWAWRWPPRV